MARCLIGLGANLGDRQATLNRAIELLMAQPHIPLLRQSAWHATTPIGGPAGQEEFLNGAVLLETSLSPRQVHAELRCIEAALGRRRGERWAPRLVDLDLLLFEDVQINTPDLVVPHPRMALRRFVLEPAAEVAADLVHPQIGWTIGQLLEHLNLANPYVAIVGVPGVGKTALAESLAQRFEGRAIVDPLLATVAAAGGLDKGKEKLVEMRLIEHRTGLLEAVTWDAAQPPSISDFWLDQSLAYATIDPRGESPESVRRTLEIFGRGVVTPKLLVILDPPVETTSHDPADMASRESRSKLRAALVDVATPPGRGPWLHLTTSDAAANFAETAAAIEAM